MLASAQTLTDHVTAGRLDSGMVDPEAEGDESATWVVTMFSEKVSSACPDHTACAGGFTNTHG